MIILENRNGIKTKIEGDNEWFYYDRDSRQSNLFVDRYGNQIFESDVDQIVWNGRNGKRYTLKKVSNSAF